jgi:hypothetical protein
MNSGPIRYRNLDNQINLSTTDKHSAESSFIQNSHLSESPPNFERTIQNSKLAMMDQKVFREINGFVRVKW